MKQWTTGLTAMAALTLQLACSKGQPTPVDVTDSGMGGEAASCPVLSSKYDQSCAMDSDCLVVNEVLSCPATSCAFCETGVINKAAGTSYMQAFSAATAGVALDAAPCNCGAVGAACCRAGKCVRSCN